VSQSGEERLHVPSVVLDAVLELLNAPDVESKQLIVERYVNELLGDYADPVLQALVANNPDQPDAESVVEWHRTLLADCRERGVAEAFAQRMRPIRRAVLMPQVLDRLATMTDDEEIFRFLAGHVEVKRLLLEALYALATADGPRGKLAVFQREGDLLLTAAAELVFRTADTADLQAHADLVAAARRDGVEFALREAFGESDEVEYGVAIPPEAQSMLEEFLYAENTLAPERREEICRNVLAVTEPRTPLWGAFKNFLASALLLSRSSDRAAKLEEAIEHYSDCLRFYRDTNQAYGMISAHLGLSDAFRERSNGDRAANLSRAVEEADCAVGMLEPGTPPDEVLRAHYTLGCAYHERGSDGDQAAAQSHAMVVLRRLGTDTQNRQFVAVQQLLGRIARAGGPDEHRDGGVTYFQRARAAVLKDTDFDDWEMLTTDLAMALLNRNGPSRQEDAEAAIELLEQALVRVDPGIRRERWATIHDYLSEAYRWRRARDEDLASAVFHAEQALTVFTEEAFGRQWASAQEHLADGLRELESGNPLVNGYAALEIYERLDSFYLAAGDELARADIQEKIAFAHASRNLSGFEDGHFPRAVEHLRRALPVFARHGLDDRVVQIHLNMLGFGTQAVARGEGSTELVTEIRAQAERLLAASPKGDRHLLSSVHRTLGLLDLAQGADTASQHLRRALEISPERDVSFLDIHLPLALLDHRQGNTGSAIRLCRQAIDLGEELILQTGSNAGRSNLLSSVGRLYEQLAFWRLQASAWPEALALLEAARSRSERSTLDYGLDVSGIPESAQARIRRARNRVRRLRAELRAPNTAEQGKAATINRQLAVAQSELAASLAAAGLDQDGEATTALSGAELCGLIPPHGVLVAPIVADDGAAMLVIPSGTAELTSANVILLPKITIAEVAAAEARWVQAEEQWSRHTMSFAEWTAVLDTTTSWLWNHVAEPLTQSLRSLDVAPEAALWFVSSLLSRQLPLHAAWRDEGGEKMTLLDDHPIAYTPCVQLLHETARRAVRAGAQDQSITVFADPLGDLPSARIEANAISTAFAPDAVKVLTGEQVVAANVLSLAPSRTYVHFACHAAVNWVQPDFCSVLLADGMMTAAELSSLDLTRTRLAVLSACRTGVSTILPVSSEYTGLAAELLRAGASAVVATLWSVDDDATALLMRRFYDFMVREGKAPIDALRRSQLWLRDATISELHRPTLPTDDDHSTIWRMPHASQGDRPYENAQFWAGFYLVGT